VTRRTQRLPKPDDDFYRPITEERRAELIKQLRLRGGTGDHEKYLIEYSDFLERQVEWEAQRLQQRDFTNEVQSMLKSLGGVRHITDSLAYVVENPTPEEKAVARETFRQRVPDPKRWWKALERDWEWQTVGGNVIEEIERYKLDLYRKRNLKLAGL
jgi:predicted Mrr-cat superfamily restriction endonuclease